MDLDIFFRNNFSAKEYEKYMTKWLSGIKDEIWFWDAYFQTKGLDWKSGYKKMISYERKFALEDHLENMEKTVFLDVGSGPLSSCGSRTTKTNLELCAVDPLALVYKKIKKKYNIHTKIQPEFAMVEKLSEKFGTENTFDIVHMRNALDHSFNPIMGLLQMLYVCKIGGKVILFHRNNEAVYEKYGGFHQWNLLEKQGHFIIWRDKKYFDISEIFGNRIEISTKPAKNRVGFHEICIRKKEAVRLVNDPLIEIYNRRLFNKLLECVLEEFYIEKSMTQSKKYQVQNKLRGLLGRKNV